MTNTEDSASQSWTHPALLLRRLTLWVLFALVTFQGFIFSVCSAALKHVTDDMLGGKPLPMLSDFVFNAGWLYAVLPALAFLVALAFTAWKQPSETLTLVVVIAVVLLVGLLLFIFCASVSMPFVHSHGGMQQQT